MSNQHPPYGKDLTQAIRDGWLLPCECGVIMHAGEDHSCSNNARALLAAGDSRAPMITGRERKIFRERREAAAWARRRAVAAQ